MLTLALSLMLAAPANDPALDAQIAAADATLFHIAFEECDPAKLATLVTDDLEFVHDKGGFLFHDAKSFVADYAKSCEAKKAPDSWRSRRELVAGSMHVDPVPGYGAIEEGDHVFYERKGDGPEKLVGRAHFVQLWQQTPPAGSSLASSATGTRQ